MKIVSQIFLSWFLAENAQDINKPSMHINLGEIMVPWWKYQLWSHIELNKSLEEHACLIMFSLFQLKSTIHGQYGLTKDQIQKLMARTMIIKLLCISIIFLLGLFPWKSGRIELTAGLLNSQNPLLVICKPFS